MNAPEVVSEAYRHCAQLIRAHDKDRFLAALYAPAERRPFLHALYAFALETARVRHLVREPMAGTIRLQWWREALAGLRTEEVAASPVMIALQDASRQAGVTLAPLAAVVEARQNELRGEPTQFVEAAVFVVAARLLGVSDDVTDLANAAGEAIGLVSVAPDKARDAYVRFRERIDAAPEQVLPAFLPVTLVPLLLRKPNAPQWRRQLALFCAAHFGFASP
jgi:phytoene/squalene synthetase